MWQGLPSLDSARDLLRRDPELVEGLRDSAVLAAAPGAEASPPASPATFRQPTLSEAIDAVPDNRYSVPMRRSELRDALQPHEPTVIHRVSLRAIDLAYHAAAGKCLHPSSTRIPH